MNVSERLKNLEIYATEKEMKKQRRIERERQEEMTMTKQIMSLKPRIENLMLIANSCLSKGIYIGRPNPLRGYPSRGYGTKDGYFLADAVRLGFDTDGRRPVYYLVIRGGGFSEHYKLKTDGEMVEIEGKKLSALKRFLNEFDEFEKEFYAYVDKFIDSNSK